MILSRETSAACSARGGSITSRSTPSTRKRTTERDSYGSKCRSDARSLQRLQQQRVDHADHRRLRLVVEQVGGDRQVLHQPREVAFARELLAASPRRRRPALYGARELGGEALGVDVARHERALAARAAARRGRRRVASGRISTTTASPSSPDASTPCCFANAYGNAVRTAAATRRDRWPSLTAPVAVGVFGMNGVERMRRRRRRTASAGARHARASFAFAAAARAASGRARTVAIAGRMALLLVLR